MKIDTNTTAGQGNIRKLFFGVIFLLFAGVAYKVNIDNLKETKRQYALMQLHESKCNDTFNLIKKMEIAYIQGISKEDQFLYIAKNHNLNVKQKQEMAIIVNNLYNSKQFASDEYLSRCLVSAYRKIV